MRRGEGEAVEDPYCGTVSAAGSAVESVVYLSVFMQTNDRK